MIYLDENFYSNFKFLSAEQIGKIVKKLALGEDFEKYDDSKLNTLENELLDKLQQLNTQKKAGIQERIKRGWETKRRKKAEQLASVPSVPSVVTLPASAPAPATVQPPKKLTLKEKNPVFWEAIQRKKHVLTDQLI